jgi:hypothetical protein
LDELRLFAFEPRQNPWGPLRRHIGSPATHNLELARRCDRIIEVVDGRIQDRAARLSRLATGRGQSANPEIGAPLALRASLFDITLKQAWPGMNF